MRIGIVCLALIVLAGCSRETAPGGEGLDAVRLVRVPDSGIQPEAVVAGDGTIHLIYFRGEAAHGDLYYMWSDDDGASFSAPIRVNSQPGSAIATGTIRGGQIAVSSSGRVHVAWNGSAVAEPRGPVNPAMGEPGSPMLYASLVG